MIDKSIKPNITCNFGNDGNIVSSRGPLVGEIPHGIRFANHFVVLIDKEAFMRSFVSVKYIK